MVDSFEARRTMIGSLSESVEAFVCLPVFRMGADFAFVLIFGGVGASAESTLLIVGFLATPFFTAGAGGTSVVEGVVVLAVAVRALVTRVTAGIEEAVFVREDALVALGLLVIGKDKLKSSRPQCKNAFQVT